MRSPTPCRGVACLAEFSSPFWDAPNATSKLATHLMDDREAVLGARDRSSHSALNMAAFRSNVGGVKALIAAGADVDNPDRNLHRPLHHSVLGPMPKAEVVRALLAAGATRNATAKDGKTALDYSRNRAAIDPSIVGLLQDGRQEAGGSSGPAVALVVGASRGIGLELVRGLAASVAGPMQVHATLRDWSRPGDVGRIGGVLLHQLDVVNSSQLDELAAELERTRVAIDLLIHSAGTMQGSLEEQMKTNADAPFRVIAALLPAVLRSRQKRVAVITSDLGTRPRMDRLKPLCQQNASEHDICQYSQSKFAANEHFRQAEPEWRRQGILAVAIQPGYVSTDMNHGHGKITATQSARGILGVCKGLQTADAGKFLDYRRRVVAWRRYR